MILDEIAAAAHKRVAEAKKKVSCKEMRARAEALGADTGFPFERALEGEGISFICEVKKASPSKGLAAGVSAVSVLTEPDYFLGDIGYLREIAKEIHIPALRKDFTVDGYMIYEAKAAGAAAVLLICALLEKEAIRDYIDMCDSLGLSALVEAHDEREIEEAVWAGARIIGVNNRNLKNFTVDIKNSIRLRERVPSHIYFVAESGIRTREDILELEAGKVNAVLIGETLMRSGDKKKILEELRGR